jgi:hypothetical protein
MTEAEKAYAEAERMIAEAKQTGGRLNFDHPLTIAMAALPPEISNMRKLRLLSLSNTQITDAALERISGLSGLKSLYVDNTQITDAGLVYICVLGGLRRLNLINTKIIDLRPLRQMKSLLEIPEGGGLSFRNCAAAKADPRIAKIAAIEDSKTRAQALFDLIDAGWLPPGEITSDTPTAPSFTLPPDGPMQSQDAAPIGGDEDQEDLRQDLLRKISNTIEAIGTSNEWAGLRASAEHYRTQITKPLPDIRLKRLYSAANTLRVAFEANTQVETLGRNTDLMPPLVFAALQDVVQTHGLFFMGFPNAAEIHAQMLAGLTGARRPAEVAAAAPLVESLENKPRALDAEDQAAMADDLAAAKGEGPSAEIGENSLRGRMWNMLGAFGRKVVALGSAGIATLSGHYFILWVQANEAAILAWLTLTQGAASGWFATVMAILKGLL